MVAERIGGGLMQLSAYGAGGMHQELTGNTSNACPYNINNSMNQYFFEYPRGQLNNKSVLDKSVLNKENIIERISSDENELKYKEEMELKYKNELEFKQRISSDENEKKYKEEMNLKYKNELEFKQDELKYKKMSDMERISSDENELIYKEEIKNKRNIDREYQTYLPDQLPDISTDLASLFYKEGTILKNKIK